MKQMVFKPVLALSNAQLQLLLMDTSAVGVGAVWIQNGKPVACAIRSVTHLEKKCPIIKTERTVIVWFIKIPLLHVGTWYWIRTVHRPLVGLAEKEFQPIWPRVVSFMVGSVQCVLKGAYIAGQSNVLPVFLSWPSRNVDRVVTESHLFVGDI